MKRGRGVRTGGWCVGLYIRLSREDGGDESLSVANQRKILLEFVGEAFGQEDALMDEYVDDGATGTDHDRPQFQRMLRDIEEGRVNCVVCKTLSRAFRNYADQGYFLENFFPRHGARFISLGAPRLDSFLDPEAVHGYEVPISGIVNDRYAGRTSMDVRRTFDMKRRKGEFIGAFAPYGYEKDPQNKNRLVIDREAAEVVRDIFCWYMEGTSKRGIAKRLNELAVPSPAAYKKRAGLKYRNPKVMAGQESLWGPRTIADILKNQVYAGDMVQGRQRVISYKIHDRVAPPREEWFVAEQTHAPIIERDTFQAVQELCRRDTRTPPGARQVYLLSGLVYCADCGRAMARNSSRGHAYYRCRTVRDQSQRHCTGRSIRVDQVEQVVLSVLQRQIELLKLPETLAGELSRSPVREPEAGGNALLRRRQGELARIRDIMDGLYVDWRGGVLSEEEYRRIKEKLTCRADRLEAAAARLEKERAARQEAGAQPYLAAFLECGNLPYLERELVVELVERILVHRGGQLEIRFRFADQHRRA